MKSIFIEEGNFYKGNLHCHTTVSDGSFKPSSLIELYKNAGYDFLVVSDHDVYSNYQQYSCENFTCIAGFESAGASGAGNGGPIYHFLVIANDPESCYEHGERFELFADKSKADLQKMINGHIANNHSVIAAHPHWSSMTAEHLKGLNGLLGMEVYNGNCEKLYNLGTSIETYDELLRTNHHHYAFASDDCHYNDIISMIKSHEDDGLLPMPTEKIIEMMGLANKEATNNRALLQDYHLGWIEVKAKSNSHKDIMEAINKGSFYASSGPKLYEYNIEGDVLTVTFDKAKYVYTHNERGPGGYHLNTTDGKSTVKFGITGHEKYIRVELVDECGKHAWSNPIWLN